uniref:Uncharacterized protein n=1 Tax=Panagrolaimus sp. JU765 TaxID=591449 RepID=A0AC34RG22_9BILA
MGMSDEGQKRLEEVVDDHEIDKDINFVVEVIDVSKQPVADADLVRQTKVFRGIQSMETNLLAFLVDGRENFLQQSAKGRLYSGMNENRDGIGESEIGMDENGSGIARSSSMFCGLIHVRATKQVCLKFFCINCRKWSSSSTANKANKLVLSFMKAVAADISLLEKDVNDLDDNQKLVQHFEQLFLRN